MSINNLEIGYPTGMLDNNNRHNTPSVRDGLTRLYKLATCYRTCKPEHYGFTDRDLQIHPQMQALTHELLHALTVTPLDTPCKIVNVNFLSNRIVLTFEKIGE